jgi:hypothetical protein
VTASDKLGIFLTTVMIIILGLYMSFYQPPPIQVRSGECIKYREAKQSYLFSSNVECVEWQP